jgi:hypothetical protein
MQILVDLFKNKICVKIKIGLNFIKFMEKFIRKFIRYQTDGLIYP